jgi:hypothetical protein
MILVARVEDMDPGLLWRYLQFGSVVRAALLAIAQEKCKAVYTRGRSVLIHVETIGCTSWEFSPPNNMPNTKCRRLENRSCAHCPRT